MLYIDKEFIAYWVYKWMDAFIVQTNDTVNTSRISSISETKLLPLLVQNSLTCNGNKARVCLLLKDDISVVYWSRKFEHLEIQSITDCLCL